MSADRTAYVIEAFREWASAYATPYDSVAEAVAAGEPGALERWCRLLDAHHDAQERAREVAPLAAPHPYARRVLAALEPHPGAGRPLRDLAAALDMPRNSVGAALVELRTLNLAAFTGTPQNSKNPPRWYRLEVAA